VVVYVCIYMYVNVCLRLFVLFNVYIYYKKCVLKKTQKVVGHDMYIIDILMCGTYYDNSQD
jgi:hypothetical protein